MRIGLLNWTEKQLESIKRDILFFDKFYYDPILTEKKLDNFESIANTFSTITKDAIAKETTGTENSINLKSKLDKTNDIYNYCSESRATIEYLKIQKIIEPVNIMNPDGMVENFKNNYSEYTSDEIMEILKYFKEVFTSSNYLNNEIKLKENTLNLNTSLNNSKKLAVSLYHLNEKMNRVFPLLIQNDSGEKLIPLKDNLTGLKTTKEANVIRLIIKNVPVPDGETPFDEIIDFKNENKRKYLAMTR